MKNIRIPVFVFLLAGLFGCAGTPTMETTLSCGKKSGKILDEARCAGRNAESFPGAEDDYMADMDYGISRDPARVAELLDPYVPGISPADATRAVVKGRNNWIVWTGGNDKFWDFMSRETRGILDFLKTLSSHPSQKKYNRDNRWRYLGLVNEPCFEKPTAPRADRHGLWLDVRSPGCEADPFEDETRYPGVKIGARGRNIEVGSYYGYATGIVGLRLFPNPEFDEDAEKKWDPERYYTDPSYYEDKDLVKPYRVGMSCGFCHVGPNPVNPPEDPENPEWANLNSNPGAQYFWVDRIFVWDPEGADFPYQLFHTSRPGALDTSFISTDYMNNPRTMNAVYSLGARMAIAARFGKEKLGGGELDNEQLNQYLPADSPLNRFYQSPDTVWTPMVLKDGADSVGALGALNRVFINIGVFGEQWVEHFTPLVGGTPFTPFSIETANKNSTYWNATEAQTPDLALFFLATGKPDYLKNAPGGDQYLSEDEAVLKRGKEVFGERCVRCHSSKLPEEAFAYFPDDGCNGADYLSCWNEYWDWTQTDDARKKFTEIALQDDFLKDNFLSNELRVPVTLLETNACASLATNALKGDIWDNFSSESYKQLPSVGSVTVHHPVTREPSEYRMPAGGRGYIRPASLISLWSTAPFLLNNTVGSFEWSGTVEARMRSFDDSIHQLLWPETRRGDKKFVTASGKMLPGLIDVTSENSYLRVPIGYLPDWLQSLSGPLSYTSPWLIGENGVELGPIPKGTPINLIANLDLEQRWEVLKVLKKVKKVLKSIPEGASDAEIREMFAGVVDPMLSLSKCPDFVVNRGHYFGTDYFAGEPGLSDADKTALVEFLKTM